MRIITSSGLDPANFIPDMSVIDDRIDPTDAQQVDIIHTDDVMGILQPLGTIDFFVNGGANQPGCPEGEGTSYARVMHREHMNTFICRSLINDGCCANHQDAVVITDARTTCLRNLFTLKSASFRTAAILTSLTRTETVSATTVSPWASSSPQSMHTHTHTIVIVT